MSLIEGIGDEVTFMFAGMLVILLLICAWFSTHTRDIPLFSLLIVELTGRMNRSPSPATSNETESSTDETNTESLESSPTETPEVSPTQQDDLSPQTNVDDGTERETNPSSNTDRVNEITVTENVTDVNTVRQRRLEFLSKKANQNSSEVTSEISDDVVNTDNVNAGNTPKQTDENKSDVTEPTDDDQPSLVHEIELEEGSIRVRLKYLNETQRSVQTNLLQTIGQFKRMHFESELAANKLVRLIYNGQCLQNDTSTLQSYNIHDNCTVHCLVTEARQATQPQVEQNSSNVDLSMLMFPAFALLLVIVWYFRFTYRQYFNAMSTLSLIGITFLFSIAVLSSWRTRRYPGEHQHLD